MKAYEQQAVVQGIDKQLLSANALCNVYSCLRYTVTAKKSRGIASIDKDAYELNLRLHPLNCLFCCNAFDWQVVDYFMWLINPEIVKSLHRYVFGYGGQALTVDCNIMIIKRPILIQY